jgi:hypothetical protein
VGKRLRKRRRKARVVSEDEEGNGAK